MNLQERGKEMAKKDFLNSLAQEVEDTKKGKEPSSKVTSFEEYDKLWKEAKRTIKENSVK